MNTFLRFFKVLFSLTVITSPCSFIVMIHDRMSCAGIIVINGTRTKMLFPYELLSY